VNAELQNLALAEDDDDVDLVERVDIVALVEGPKLRVLLRDMRGRLAQAAHGVQVQGPAIFPDDEDLAADGRALVGDRADLLEVHRRFAGRPVDQETADAVLVVARLAGQRAEALGLQKVALIPVLGVARPAGVRVREQAPRVDALERRPRVGRELKLVDGGAADVGLAGLLPCPARALARPYRPLADARADTAAVADHVPHFDGVAALGKLVLDLLAHGDGPLVRLRDLGGYLLDLVGLGLPLLGEGVALLHHRARTRVS